MGLNYEYWTVAKVMLKAIGWVETNSLWNNCFPFFTCRGSVPSIGIGKPNYFPAHRSSSPTGVERFFFPYDWFCSWLFNKTLSSIFTHCLFDIGSLVDPCWFKSVLGFFHCFTVSPSRSTSRCLRSFLYSSKRLFHVISLVEKPYVAPKHIFISPPAGCLSKNASIAFTCFLWCDALWYQFGGRERRLV